MIKQSGILTPLYRGIQCLLPFAFMLSTLGQPPANDPTSIQPAEWQDPPGQEILRFRNGDVLFGNLIEMQGGNKLVWHHSNAVSPLEFRLNNIKDIRFPSLPSLPYPDKANCEIVLSSNELIRGTLVKADTTSLTVQTGFAGEWIIPRKHVVMIKPEPPNLPDIWQGIDGLEDWTIGKVELPGRATGVWKYHSGSIYATEAASLARDVGLPDKARIEMDLEWKGILSVAIALYTDYWEPINLANKEQEPDFGGFYSLAINNSAALLRSVTKMDPIKQFPMRSVKDLTIQTKAHVEIMVDKTRNLIALIINGEPIEAWEDGDGFVGEGTGVRLVHQGQGSIKISNFKVREWDGRLRIQTMDPSRVTTDTAVMPQGQPITGRWISADSERVILEVDQQPTEIKWAALDYFFAANPVTPELGDPLPYIRASIRGGGSLVLHVENWTQEGLYGRSPGLGPVTIHPAAIEKLEFAPNN